MLSIIAGRNRRDGRPIRNKAQRSLIRKANEARDGKLWADAAVFYKQYLNELPADPAIWTQLGHALKESGDLAGGEAAYRTGLAFAPQDAELYLQLGHVLKLSGRLAEAQQAYERCTALDATLGAENQISWERGGDLVTNSTSAASVGAEEQPPLSPTLRRILGDQARDDGRWSDAVVQYQSYLDSAEGDAAIWVQYGHALKESGSVAESEYAYRRALRLEPEDADIELQLGHSLKVQGRKREAVMAYRRSLNIKATRSVISELNACGNRVDYFDIPLSPQNTAYVFLEISDLIATMQEYHTISGIQRVQLGLLRFVLSSPKCDDYQVVFWENGLLWSIPKLPLTSTLDIYNHTNDLLNRKRIVDVTMQLAQPVRPGPGDIFVITGAVWMRPHAVIEHERVRHSGACLGAYIYDFIPLTNPEYCHPYLTERFSNTMSELLLQLDFALTISEYVGAELKRLTKIAGYQNIPSTSVKLAHVLDFKNVDEGSSSSVTRSLAGAEFVLCVGSIAAHKNHLYAIQVWRLLIESGVFPPILVIAGKRGYGAEDLFTQLTNTNYLDGRVKVVEGLDDDSIAELYTNCLFTLFPSYVEGWGLPVGESLAHGKICLASKTTSIPEVGEDFVCYIDPYNVRSATNTIATLLGDRERLHRLELNIRQNFRARTWEEFGQDFVTAVRQHAKLTLNAAAQLRPLDVLLPRPTSTMWQHGKSLPPTRDFVIQTIARSSLIAGWFPPEDWGCWMDGAEARLSIQTDQIAKARVRLILQLRSVFWPRQNKLFVSAGDDSASMEVPTGAEDFALQLDCTVAANGRIDVELRLAGTITAGWGEERILGVGLRKLFFNTVDTRFDHIKAGTVVRPTSLVGNTGASVSGHSPAALIEAARRQSYLTDGWLKPEPWGTWMGSSSARLMLQTDAAPGVLIRTVLKFRSIAPRGGSLVLQIDNGTPSTLLLMAQSNDQVLANVTGETDRDGKVCVNLTTYPRDVRIGICSMTWGKAGDISDEAKLGEAILFGLSQSSPNDQELLSRDIGFTVTGHIKGSYSLASVNRRLAAALDGAYPEHVKVIQVEGQLTTDLHGLDDPDKSRMLRLMNTGLAGAGPEVVISQHWPVWQPRPKGDLTLAYVFWEESLVPAQMINALNEGFDAVLTPARSVSKALIDSGLRLPIRCIGFAPNLAPFHVVAEARREAIRGTVSHQEPFTFLHLSSCFPRKGVDVLIAAYAKAFTVTDPVRLIVKGFPNPHNDVAEQLSRLREAHAHLAAVEFINHDLDEHRILELYRSADCIVLPTRGEGFNIPAAEALAAGVPLIVTRFGGQMDFLTDGVARLIDYRFTHSQSHLQTSSSVWVEPDVDDLVKAMREAVTQPITEQVMSAGRERARQIGDGSSWARRIEVAATNLLTSGTTSQPKVAWVSTWAIRCGIAEYSRMLLASYPEASRDVTVLCDTRTLDDDIRASELTARKAWRRIDGSSINELAEAIQQTEAQTVVIQYHHALINWNDLATLLQDSRVKRRQIVVFMHNTKELLEAEWGAQARFLEALRGADRVLVHTVADLNLLKAQGLVENVALFPHGAPTMPLKPKLARKIGANKDLLIGAYGFFLPHKGFEHLIRALIDIRRVYPRVKLRLVTAEYPTRESANEVAKCKELADSLNLTKLIDWHLDYLTNDASLELLSACDLVVLPYQDTPESSSAAVRTAMSAGAPVLVTPTAIFEEMNDAVVRTTGFQASDIGNAILYLAEHQEARSRLADRSAKWLDENSWSNVSRRLNAMLHGLAASET